MPAEHRHQSVRGKWYDRMRILKGDAVFQPSLYYFQMHHSGGGTLTLKDLCSGTFHGYQIWIGSSIEMFFSKTRLIKKMRQLDCISWKNLVGACLVPSVPIYFKENLKGIHSKVHIYMKRIHVTRLHCISQKLGLILNSICHFLWNLKFKNTELI